MTKCLPPFQVSLDLANDGPLNVAFGSSLPSSTKKTKTNKTKKNIVKVGPPLTKCYGSVQLIMGVGEGVGEVQFGLKGLNK